MTPAIRRIFSRTSGRTRAHTPKPFDPKTHESDPHAAVIAELVRSINQDSDAAFRSMLRPPRRHEPDQAYRDRDASARRLPWPVRAEQLDVYRSRTATS
jgi:hypothetical protein